MYVPQINKNSLFANIIFQDCIDQLYKEAKGAMVWASGRHEIYGVFRIHLIFFLVYFGSLCIKWCEKAIDKTCSILK